MTPNPGFRPARAPFAAPDSDEEVLLDEEDEELEDGDAVPVRRRSAALPRERERTPHWMMRYIFMIVAAVILLCVVGIAIVGVSWFISSRNSVETNATAPANLEIVVPGQVVEIDPQIVGCFPKPFVIPDVADLPEMGQSIKLVADVGTACEFTVTIYVVPLAESEK